MKERCIGLVWTSWESCHPQMSSASSPSELSVQVVRRYAGRFGVWGLPLVLSMDPGFCSLHCGSVKISPQYLTAVLLVRLQSPLGGVFSIIVASSL